MPEENNHISYSATDIRKYHNGELTARQMHELEKAALDDPFLADAIEGYQSPGVSLPADIDELRKRLQEKSEEKKAAVITMRRDNRLWLRIAAMIVAVAGGGLLIYQLGSSNEEKDTIAQAVTTSKQERSDSFPKTDALAQQAEAASQKPDTVKGIVTQLGPLTDDRQQPAAGISAVPIPGSDSLKSFNFSPQSSPAAARPVQAEHDVASLMEKKVPGAIATPPADSMAAKDLVNDKNALNEVATLQRMAGATDEANKTKAIANRARAQTQVLRPRYFFRGKITDANNNSLPFANITNVKDNVGTYTDAKGNFTLTSTDSVLNVQIRSLGFENSITDLHANATGNQVSLKEDRSIPEVVISNKKINSRSRDGNMVLEEPEPADGWNNYDTYLANNLKMPEVYFKKSNATTAGQVELSFQVNEAGEPTNIKVERSLCEVCDKEAIRLLKDGPKWKRKAKKGRTTVTISF